MEMLPLFLMSLLCRALGAPWPRRGTIQRSPMAGALDGCIWASQEITFTSWLRGSSCKVGVFVWHPLRNPGKANSFAECSVYNGLQLVLFLSV